MSRPLTEAKWNASRDPIALLEHVYPMRGLDSAMEHMRASRLYLLACARRAWPRLPWCGRKLVEIAERVVDGDGIGDELRRAARQLAEDLTHCRGEPEDLLDVEHRLQSLDDSIGRRTEPDPTFKPKEWSSLAHLVFLPFARTTPNYRLIAAADHSLERCRDVFPSPFQDARIAPEWRSSTVASLARTIHASRDFSQMRLLADAMEDAGCVRGLVLDHCRSPGLHVRGCWVVEGILHPPALRVTGT